MTKVFLIQFHVTAMESSIMPDGLSGAYVICYARGDDHIEATKASLQQLLRDGLDPQGVHGPVREMDVEKWSEHIEKSWPEYTTSLPTQAEFKKHIQENSIVYGPFCAYEQK